MFKTVNMLVVVTPKMAESSKTLATARTTVSSRVGTTPLFWEPSPLSGYSPFSEANLKNYSHPSPASRFLRAIMKHFKMKELHFVLY